MLPIGYGLPNPVLGRGDVSGSGANPQIAYWTGPNSVGGDPNIIVDSAAHRVIVGGATVAQVPVGNFTGSVISTRSALLANHDSGFTAISWSATGSASSFFNVVSSRGAAGAPAQSKSGDLIGRFSARAYYDDGAGTKNYTNEIGQFLFHTAEDQLPFQWGSTASVMVTQPTTQTLVESVKFSWDRIAITGHDFLLDAGPFEVDPTSALTAESLVFNGSKWVAGPVVTIAAVEPSPTFAGMLWLDNS